MQKFFEKVFVISLENAEGKKRKCRLEGHLEEVGWELGEVEWVRAVHGDTVGVQG